MRPTVVSAASLLNILAESEFPDESERRDIYPESYREAVKSAYAQTGGLPVCCHCELEGFLTDIVFASNPVQYECSRHECIRERARKAAPNATGVMTRTVGGPGRIGDGSVG